MRSTSKIIINTWASLTLILGLLLGCQNKQTLDDSAELSVNTDSPFLVVLGIAQDAGFPQSQCKRECCQLIWDYPEKHRRATCLALVDPGSNKYWLFEATPDYKSQTREVESQWDVELAGIFLTHAHAGHYIGLYNLGKEVTGSGGIPVYAMPKMKGFLESNGPWDQLVRLHNIELIPLQADSTVNLNSELSIIPFLVPHRDEYSETVGYKISGPNEQAMFIPDIDKWERWDRDLRGQTGSVNLAFIDASFFKNGEIPGRDMSAIPHPFVTETMQLLNDLSEIEKRKIHFIHFNHTNPLLHTSSKERGMVEKAGFSLAEEGAIFPI